MAAGIEAGVEIETGPETVPVRVGGCGEQSRSRPGEPPAAPGLVLERGPEGVLERVALPLRHAERVSLTVPLTPGEVPAPFLLPDVDGALVALDPSTHPATVVVFTANACPWALGWHARVRRVAQDYAGRGVCVLHINANDPAVSAADSIERSRERVRDHDFTGPYLIDPGQEVARTWGARRTPDAFVLDRAGRVVYHGAPDASVDLEDLQADWLRAGIDAALDGSPAHLAETTSPGSAIRWTP